jgi:hypothetical protein
VSCCDLSHSCCCCCSWLKGHTCLSPTAPPACSPLSC